MGAPARLRPAVELKGADDVEDVALLLVLGVSEVVRALTIWASMTGRYRLEVVAGMAVVPLEDANSRLLSCRVSRLPPAVLTRSRLPDTLPWADRSWKVWPALTWKPL